MLQVSGATMVPILETHQDPPTRANIRKFKRFRDCVHADWNNFCAFPHSRFDAKRRVLAYVGGFGGSPNDAPKRHQSWSTSLKQHEFPVFGDERTMNVNE